MNSHHDRSGETIANFRLINPIGAGNVGIVYNALQLSMNRKVALKILQPELAENPDDIPLVLLLQIPHCQIPHSHDDPSQHL